MSKIKLTPSLLFALCSLLFLASCSKMGYGVLLWSIEEPPIPSGTVLPVFIRSNITQSWVVGIPRELIVNRNDINRIEVPLARLEFVGSRRRALARAEEFAPYAALYAENLQDGLPIRNRPDNNATRVYRLRAGDVIKILGTAQGTVPIAASGDPLPGEWLRVLTRDGVVGFCFSNRLRIFENYTAQEVQANAFVREVEPDPDLDMVLSRTWSPEFYLQMINSRRINIHELERRFRFDPGQDTGRARIFMPDIEREFIYESIVREGDRAWRFEGSDLRMNLRNNTTLAVQFTEGTGLRRTLVFVSLVSSIDDLIIQEQARRENQFMEIFNQGPVFTSNNFGTITFRENGTFTWTGFDLLVPQLIPAGLTGEGRVHMDLFIAQAFADRFDGAFTFRFSDRNNTAVSFMYNMDHQGMRLEALPSYTIEDITVTRRSVSPLVLYFFKDSPSF